MNIPLIVLELLAIAAVALAVLLVPKHWKAVILICTAFLPLSLGKVSSFEDVLLSEWVPVVLLPATLGGIFKSRRSLFSSWSWVLVAALVAFGVVAVVNGIRFSGSASNYLRAYWKIACGLMYFLELAWYGQWLSRNGWALRKALWTIVGVAFVASAARVANYYLGMPLPLLAGGFDYAAQQSVGGALVDRIGGLTESIALGLSALAALAQLRVAGRLGLAFAAWCAIMVIVAGGRMFAVAVILTVLVYVLVSTGRRRLQAAVAIVVAGTVVVAALSFSGVSRQIARLTAFAGGLKAQDPYRYAAERAQIEQFKLRPWLGKGVGVRPPGDYTDFAVQQATFGGHGSYTSILCNFGIVGMLFLASFLLVPAIGAWRLQKRLRQSGGSRLLVALAFFVLTSGVIRLVLYVTGGDGYSDMGLYVIAGLFASCLCVARREERTSK